MTKRKPISAKTFLRLTGSLVAIIIFAFSFFIWVMDSKKDIIASETAIIKSYEQVQKDEKPCVIMFYAQWCTYCQKFMPKYEQLSKKYKEKYNFVMIDGDKSSNMKLMKEYSVEGFPTIYIIDPLLDNRILISNTTYDDLAKIEAELNRYLRIRSMINKK